MIVYVARHGETDWNRDGRYQGRLESRLTELGTLQAEALGRSLAARRVERIVSSPLGRCVETAAPLAPLAGAAIELDDRLVEIAHGTWEGRLREELALDDPQRMRAWRERPETVQFDGGETLADVATRWRRFARSLTGKNDVAVVTHDVLVRVAVLWAGERPLSELWQPRVSNGGYAAFDAGTWPWRQLEECHDEHLAGLIADTSRQAL